MKTGIESLGRGHFRKQKIENMLNERHIFPSFVQKCRRTRDRRNWDGFKPAPDPSPRWPRFSAFSELRLQTHTVSPTLKILESAIKTNEKR